MPEAQMDAEAMDRAVKAQLNQVLFALLRAVANAMRDKKNILMNICIEGVNGEQEGLVVYQAILNQDIEAIEKMRELYLLNHERMLPYINKVIERFGDNQDDKPTENIKKDQGFSFGKIEKNSDGSVEIKFNKTRD